jgi:tetratricopeptide repeat protein 8
MALSCLERALALANDDTLADVWYNIGQVAIGVGYVTHFNKQREKTKEC